MFESSKFLPLTPECVSSMFISLVSLVFYTALSGLAKNSAPVGRVGVLSDNLSSQTEESEKEPRLSSYLASIYLHLPSCSSVSDHGCPSITGQTSCKPLKARPKQPSCYSQGSFVTTNQRLRCDSGCTSSDWSKGQFAH